MSRMLHRLGSLLISAVRPVWEETNMAPNGRPRVGVRVL
jgi:hypothetical protein